jgi:hypothetical protein
MFVTTLTICKHSDVCNYSNNRLPPPWRPDGLADEVSHCSCIVQPEKVADFYIRYDTFYIDCLASKTLYCAVLCRAVPCRAQPACLLPQPTAQMHSAMQRCPSFQRLCSAWCAQTPQPSSGELGRGRWGSCVSTRRMARQQEALAAGGCWAYCFSDAKAAGGAPHSCPAELRVRCAWFVPIDSITEHLPSFALPPLQVLHASPASPGSRVWDSEGLGRHRIHQHPEQASERVLSAGGRGGAAEGSCRMCGRVPCW